MNAAAKQCVMTNKLGISNSKISLIGVTNNDNTGMINDKANIIGINLFLYLMVVKMEYLNDLFSNVKNKLEKISVMYTIVLTMPSE